MRCLNQLTAALCYNSGLWFNNILQAFKNKIDLKYIRFWTNKSQLTSGIQNCDITVQKANIESNSENKFHIFRANKPW